MTTADGSAETLVHAFRQFETAASGLEERQHTLQGEVRRLRQELVGAHRRLEAVLDTLDGGVAVLDREGRLIRVNRSFDRLRIGVRGEAPALPALRGLLDGPMRSGRAARVRFDSDAGPRDLNVSLTPVGDDEGTMVLNVQDVTAIRREEQEGGRRRRLEALGRMAAEIAHEVRNPLGSIRLFSEMLREDLQSRSDLREMAESILASVSGLEDTVSNLLSFASPSRGRLERVDLAALAREACALLEAACELRGLALAGPAEDVSCDLAGDREGLRRVLLNLVGNALAATETGGSIRVAVTADGDRATLVVEDDGRGIDPEDLPRVFDPFFSRTDGGTGLGLSVVHGIVEAHGGRVTLDSRPGRGTQAWVELPRRLAAARPAEGPDA